MLNGTARRTSRRLAGAAALLVLTTVSGCTRLSFIVANIPARFGDFTRQTDIPYGSGARAKLDVYAPKAAQARPVIVFWFGGSWQTGSRGDYRFAGATLAQAGYVVVIPDYRLYPQARFPDFNDDAAHAVVWAHEHAAEFGGDSAKLFVMGHSAGAHIAASMALDGRYIRRAGGDPAWIRGLIGLSGPYILKPNTPALNSIFSAPFTPADWQLQNFITAAAPPALLVHGADDKLVYPSNSEELAKQLRAAGVAVELKIVPGIGHADTLAALSVPARRRAPTLDYVRAFIDARSATPAAQNPR